MFEIFKAIIDIPVPFNMIVLIVLFGCAIGLVGTIAAEIRKYACHRQDIEFKRELVDRGLSGEEIERIVGVRPGAGGSSAGEDGYYPNAAPANS